MRVMATGKKKEGKKPVNYKLGPWAKGVVTVATGALASISPEINVNYSDFIEDSIFHLLETDTVLYQVDKEQFTLKQLLELQLANLEEPIRESVRECVEYDMDMWKAHAIEECLDNNKNDWESEFEELLEEGEYEELLEEGECIEEIKADFFNERMEEYKEEGEFEAELFEKIYEEIENQYGEVFSVAKIVNPEWSKKMEQYIQIVFEKSKRHDNKEMMMVAGVLYKNKLMYIEDENSIREYLDVELQEKIEADYIDIRLLIETIKQNYGSDIFDQINSYDIKKIILHEALNDKKLCLIAKRMEFKNKD